MLPLDWKPRLPPLETTADGQPRRVGVEIEMTGLAVDEVSAIVADRLGLSRRVRSPYEHCLSGDVAGDWRVELDFGWLKQKGRDRAKSPADGGIGDELLARLDQAAESVVAAGADLLVPVELVSPPLPMRRLRDVQGLVAGLRNAGARGTGAGLAYAFGIQFNPELPALDADTVARYLKAYLCLHDWLMRESDVDVTRRLTSFADPFPTAYLRRVVDPGYGPGLATLIDDYLADNPTRNRALDMLPLFAQLDPDRVTAAVDDDRVKARPTLHYRLPNCEIDRTGWGIHLAWNDWLEVERLAAEPAALDELCGRYAALLDRSIEYLFADWAAEVDEWLAARNAR